MQHLAMTCKTLYDKISYFKCEKCKKLKNEVICAEKLLCMNCFT